jgi:HEAT repeat protein
VLCTIAEADKECLAALLELLKQRDSKVRQQAAGLLYRYGSAAKAAVPALVEILRNDTDQQTRMAAARALGAIGPDAKAAVPTLKAAAKDSPHSGSPLNAALNAAVKKIEE